MSWILSTLRLQVTIARIECLSIVWAVPVHPSCLHLANSQQENLTSVRLSSSSKAIYRYSAWSLRLSTRISKSTTRLIRDVSCNLQTQSLKFTKLTLPRSSQNLKDRFTTRWVQAAPFCWTTPTLLSSTRTITRRTTISWQRRCFDSWLWSLRLISHKRASIVMIGPTLIIAFWHTVYKRSIFLWLRAILGSNSQILSLCTRWPTDFSPLLESYSWSSSKSMTTAKNYFWVSQCRNSIWCSKWLRPPSTTNKFTKFVSALYNFQIVGKQAPNNSRIDSSLNKANMINVQVRSDGTKRWPKCLYRS